MTQLTQRAMAASLKKMLSRKTLDKITVKEIADDCGAKRQTFYYHFKDIYDLLEWTFVQEGEQFIDAERICKNWQDVYLEVFQYIENNKNFTINAYNSMGREHLERYFYKIVYDLIALFIEGTRDSHKISQEDKDFICNFYKYALVGIILDWIRGGMKADPKVITSKLHSLLKQQMHTDLFPLSSD